MYKFRTGWEKDHERWEEVDECEQCEDCGELNRHCQCSDTVDEELMQKSFNDRYGFRERDGPPEEEERGYEDDPDEPSESDKRIW